jgi:ankyrin repeat protein
MFTNILGWILILSPIIIIIYLIVDGIKSGKKHKQDCDQSIGKQKGLNNLLFQAVQDGDIEKVKQAIADGADVNVRGFGGKTPLIRIAHRAMDKKYAKDKTNLEIARLLVAKGAEVNAKDSFKASAIEYCDWDVPSLPSQIEIATFLKDNGALENPRSSMHESIT